MSFKSHQPFVRFSLNITQMFPSVSWCAEPMARQTQSRSHFKVMGFCGRGYGCPLDCCLVIYLNERNFFNLLLDTRKIYNTCAHFVFHAAVSPLTSSETGGGLWALAN